DPMLRFVVGGLGLGAEDTLADVFDGALQRAAGENVGAYAIGRGGLAANANYEIAAFTGADLTITPATLIVSVDDQVRRQGEPNPSFTYVVDGFKFADDASVISGLTVGTSADADSSAGAYAIVASGASAANYVFEYIDGILKVVPAGVDSNIRDLSN